MTDTQKGLEAAAQLIAQDMISAARMSGDEPVVFVTGNRFMPPLRSYDVAEHIWQSEENDDGELFARLTEILEGILSDENVALECPDDDNSLYVVDLTRFEYIEDNDSDTLSGEWRMYNAGTIR